MQFVSAEFISFVAVLFAAYYLFPKKWQWPMLLAASILFFMLDDWRNGIFISITAATTFSAALWMEKISVTQKSFLLQHKSELDKQQKKVFKAKMQRKKRSVLVFGLVLNLGF